jgi:hypothetical protein
MTIPKKDNKIDINKIYRGGISNKAYQITQEIIEAAEMGENNLDYFGSNEIIRLVLENLDGVEYYPSVGVFRWGQ